jgi:two-component system, chemotaxis family, protein-glutamate methylesterase/glutaminase
MMVLKILIADDSSVTRECIKDWLAPEKELKVIGEAKDGREAFEMTKALSPNLVIMDVMMPNMNGLEATEQIMAYCPTPVLIFSSVANDREMNIVFEAISRGALDVLAKPDKSEDSVKNVRQELVKKVKFLSKVPVIHHPLAKLRMRKSPDLKDQGRGQTETLPAGQFAILGIGASTGGPQALSLMLSAFPKDFPRPVVVVQHIADAFVEGLARWLTGLTKLHVKVADDKEELKAGKVYIAPSDSHMLVKNNRVILSNSNPVNNCRPAVDILFDSLAQNYGAGAYAVLLTGMGADGARGMKAIREKGGHTVAQDQESSIIFGMPGSAIELGGVDEVVALDKIPTKIFQAFGLNDQGGHK